MCSSGLQYKEAYRICPYTLCLICSSWTRLASADEYEPAARKLASLNGMEFCDPTTFDVSRLMYWPSCCKDGEYIFEVFDYPFGSPSGSFRCMGTGQIFHSGRRYRERRQLKKVRLAKQEDPTTKRGIIGAFCRTYIRSHRQWTSLSRECMNPQ